MFKKDVLFIVPTVDRDLLGYAYIAYMLEKKYKLKAKIIPDINYIYLFHILLYAPNMVVSYQANTRHAEKVFKECKTKNIQTEGFVSKPDENLFIFRSNYDYKNIMLSENAGLFMHLLRKSIHYLNNISNRFLWVEQNTCLEKNPTILK